MSSCATHPSCGPGTAEGNDWLGILTKLVCALPLPGALLPEASFLEHTGPVSRHRECQPPMSAAPAARPASHMPTPSHSCFSHVSTHPAIPHSPLHHLPSILTLPHALSHPVPHPSLCSPSMSPPPPSIQVVSPLSHLLAGSLPLRWSPTSTLPPPLQSPHCSQCHFQKHHALPPTGSPARCPCRQARWGSTPELLLMPLPQPELLLVRPLSSPAPSCHRVFAHAVSSS